MNKSKLLTAFSVGILLLALAAFVGLVFVLPSLESSREASSSPAPDDGSDLSTEQPLYPFDIPEPIARTPITADNVGQLVELAVLKAQGDNGMGVHFSNDDPLLFITSLTYVSTGETQRYTLIYETNSFQEMANLSTFYFPPPPPSLQKRLSYTGRLGRINAIYVYPITQTVDQPEGRVVLRGHRGAVQSADFNSDQTRVVSGSFDRTLRIWDTQTGEQLLQVEFAYGVHRVAYSSDDSLAAAGLGTGEIHVLDAESGDEIAAFKDSTVPIDRLVFNRDGRFLISIRRDGTIDLWDMQSLSKWFALEGHISQITDLAFSADGSLLATSSKDATVRLWDPATGAVLWQYGEGKLSATSAEWMVALDFSPDGGLLAFLTGGGVGHVWGLPLSD